MVYSDFKGDRNDCWFCYSEKRGHFIVYTPKPMSVWKLAPKVNNLFPDEIISLERCTSGVDKEMVDCGEMTQEELDGLDFYVVY